MVDSNLSKSDPTNQLLLLTTQVKYLLTWVFVYNLSTCNQTTLHQEKKGGISN